MCVSLGLRFQRQSFFGDVVLVAEYVTFNFFRGL